MRVTRDVITAYMAAVPCNDSEVLRDAVAVALTKVDDSLSERSRSVSVLAESLLAVRSNTNLAMVALAQYLIEIFIKLVQFNVLGLSSTHFHS